MPGVQAPADALRLWEDRKYLEHVFGAPEGILAKAIAGYEERPGQIALAGAIDTAFRGGGNLVAEGPTGAGKSFAALVPAIYSGKRAIYATANISLQEQLTKKDLPFLQKNLGIPFRFMLLKGRRNYLCIRKAEEYFALGALEPGELEVRTWAETTETGDKSDLPVPCSFWWAISSSHDECLGKDCHNRWECWTTRARRGLKDAHVVVTNYHMLLLDPPEYALLICDEAHELPHIARDVAGWTVRPFSLKGLVSWLDRQDGATKRISRTITAEMQELFSRVQKYLGKKQRARLIGKPIYEPGTLISALDAASSRLQIHIGSLKQEACLIEEPKKAAGLKHKIAHLEKLAGLALGMATKVKLICSPVSENWVVWAEQTDLKKISFEGRPLDVSGYLSNLYLTASVMMSATMTTNLGFQLYRRETGAPQATAEIAVPSPFNHAHLGALIVPYTMPTPPKLREDRDAWYISLADHLAQLIEYCGGRTMAIFTARETMLEVAKILLARDLDVLTQLDRASAKEVVDVLRSGGCQAILGMDSFRTGVDIPGPALSGLFLDRLPFGVPDDPLNEALDEQIKARGGDHFAERVIPTAILQLRQGVGRLIRTSTDTGVIMIADKRLATASWCQPVLRSLPPYTVYWSLDKLAKSVRGW